MTIKVRIHAPELHFWQDRDCYTHLTFAPRGREHIYIDCSLSVDNVSRDWHYDDPMQYLRLVTAIGKTKPPVSVKHYYSEEQKCRYSCINLEYEDSVTVYQAGEIKPIMHAYVPKDN